MRPSNDMTDTKQREFDSLPLSDSTFDVLFQAPETPSESVAKNPSQE
jgi:hypothetical protein